MKAVDRRPAKADTDNNRGGAVLADHEGQLGDVVLGQPLQPCVVCAAACAVRVAGWMVHPTCYQLSTATDRGPADTTPAAPAVVLDDKSVFLAGGTSYRWPLTVDHLGDLAAIAQPLNLGWNRAHGGGLGQVWLTHAALERLGIPSGGTLLEHPMVTAALEADWSAHEDPDLVGWLTMRHPQRCPDGAVLVLMTRSSRATLAPVMDEDPGPADLVERLLDFARSAGVTYQGPAGSIRQILNRHRLPTPAPTEPQAEATTEQPEAPAEPAQSAPAKASTATATPATAAKVGVDVEPEEMKAAIDWSEQAPGIDRFTPERAHDAVQRWKEVTGCRWSGTHGVIRALLAGHTKWPGAKTPKAADLTEFERIRATETIWSARSWIITPGTLDEDSSIVGADVNAQYSASAGSVELGEGDPKVVAGKDLTPDTLKLPGWVRLAEDADAPCGLDLTVDMWVPTPLALYLERDRGVDLAVSEALVWPEKRRALKALSGLFRDWLLELKGDTTPAGSDALAMLKATYTKAFGGYLSSDKKLTDPQWRRPDWAMLLKAQAEANALRAIDKLPPGVFPRAKYADAFYLEVTEGADLSQWGNLDEVQPGKFKLMGDPVPSARFVECATPDGWRATYLEHGMGGA